ncbi:MAG: hypothetical protein ACT4OP_04360 [Actinomycetota bacterium]
MEFVEETLGAEPTKRLVGTSDDLDHAIELARSAWHTYERKDDRAYAWWTVQDPKAQYASWIADNRSRKEFVVDLRNGELIQLP